MIWPFKPKAPRLSMEEYAAQQPPAPCGEQTIHYEWEHFESMGCPRCAAKRKLEREAVERGLLAIAIVNEMQKRGLVLPTVDPHRNGCAHCGGSGYVTDTNEAKDCPICQDTDDTAGVVPSQAQSTETRNKGTT